MTQHDRIFVSRGGIKLQAALDAFSIDVSDKTVLDVGSSTGGFVDCLLQRGAEKVYALDTAYGELAWKLRNDPKVVLMERTNILHLTSLRGVERRGRHFEEDSPLGGNLVNEQSSTRSPRFARDDSGEEKVDLITIDAGWTKLELILPVVRNFLKEKGKIIALLKPHYQADKRDLRKGVLPPEKAGEVKDQVLSKIKELNFKVEQIIDSPILGGGGNKEFLLLIS